ncbi:GTPase RsgA, partial [Clostridioides difficile]
GKSSLLNEIDENFKLQTGVVSDKIKRGKHTTRHAELLKLEFGFALLHGNDSSLVKVSSISLLICKEAVSFGDKKVKIIFCLASR